ncbi:hypothetical protein E0493_22240 [Roseomonas sp. M0104]|uniref:Uncharacterized protein n=1 Tax=Teichococcus coralli TaxID=2545983 RepID=A0A845BGP6_9PROT|nr:hypothetical protein [Pseudoroseomonas coralli]MXP66068.1 hypothetical protein [Pseudoroseomonas coralli]
MLPAYAPPPEGAAPPPWAGDAPGLLEFASRLAFSTRLPEWREVPAHEALLRLAADVALQLRLQEPQGIGLDPGALPFGPAPAAMEGPPSAATQAEIAMALAQALGRGAPDPDALWFG